MITILSINIFGNSPKAQNYYNPVKYKIDVPHDNGGGSTTDYTINMSIIPEGVYIESSGPTWYNYNILFKVDVTISGYNGSANKFWNLNVGFYNSNSSKKQIVQINSVIDLVNGTKTYNNLKTYTASINENNNYTSGQTYNILNEMGFQFLNIDTHVGGHQTILGSDGSAGENGASNNFGSTVIAPYNTALPIQLTSFTGKNLSNAVLLNWRTASEINNKYFVIQRSANGNDFDSLGIVLGMGNSSSFVNYSFKDEKYQTGTNYYRLKQVDEDGKSSLSNIISINADSFKRHAVNIFPNPGNGNITIGDYSDYKSVTVYNVAGNLVLSKVPNNSFLQLPNSLADGLYFINFNGKNGDKQSVKYFLKK